MTDVDITTVTDLVISSGSELGLCFLGALHESCCRVLRPDLPPEWHPVDIERIYGTSIGGIIGCILCLLFPHSLTREEKEKKEEEEKEEEKKEEEEKEKEEGNNTVKQTWDWLLQYVIKRPWNTVIHEVMCATNGGDATCHGMISGELLMRELLQPLVRVFYSQQQQQNITLRELYEFSGITLYLYTVEVNTFTLQEVSWQTHPELSIYTAVAMTAAIPGIFLPVWYPVNNDTPGCYVDGAVLNRFPLQACLERKQNEHTLGRVWGVCCNNSQPRDMKFHPHMSTEDYFVSLVKTMLIALRPPIQTQCVNSSVGVCHCIPAPDDYLFGVSMLTIILSEDIRQRWITHGACGLYA